MPQTVSNLGFVMAGYAAWQHFAQKDTAVSREAASIHQAACSIMSDAERSHSLFGEKSSLISAIWKLTDECQDANWDGDDALPLDEHAARHAVAFIRALPSGLPLPEIAPEPDGSISLDWIQSRNRIFSISISASSRLAYCWLDGTDKGHAVSRFDGWKVPQRVIEGIQSIANPQVW